MSNQATGNRHQSTDPPVGAHIVRPPEAPVPVILREAAYGKLNLTLDVLGKRPDRYHDLEMVMCSVALSDELELTLGTGEAWSVVCDRMDLPQNEGNLCWKAARAYFDAAGLDPAGLRIALRKAIPAQAGMAGGSADAAAVLRALNRHYGLFSPEALREIGLRVGSDVPYCLFGGMALARGRGELLSRLPALPKGLCFVLAKPEFSVSTPALFRQLDAVGVTQRPDTPAMLRALEAGNAAEIGRQLANAFEPAVAADYPVVEQIRRVLLAKGALGARLTGTGSVVFGLFDDEDAARAAAAALEPLCPQTWTVAPVDNYHTH